jgi:hypothetical protein
MFCMRVGDLCGKYTSILIFCYWVYSPHSILGFLSGHFPTSFTISSNEFLSFYVQPLSIPFYPSLIHLSFRFGWILYFALTSLFICITFLCSLLFHSQHENTWLDFGEELKNQKNAQMFKSVTCNYYLPLYLDICHSFKHRKKNL